MHCWTPASPGGHSEYRSKGEAAGRTLNEQQGDTGSFEERKAATYGVRQFERGDDCGRMAASNATCGQGAAAADGHANSTTSTSLPAVKVGTFSLSLVVLSLANARQDGHG